MYTTHGVNRGVTILVRSAKNAAGTDTEPVTLRLPRKLVKAIRMVGRLPVDSPIRRRLLAEEYPRNLGGVIRWLLDDERAAMLCDEIDAAIGERKSV